MAWIIPGTAVTGNPIPASFGNDVIGDLTILETQVGVFGAATPLAGSTPALTSPTFKIQGGLTTVTFTSGFGPLTFPTAFPNGLLTFVPVIQSNTVTPYICTAYSPSTTGVDLTLANAGTGITGAATIWWLAVGF